MPTVRIANLDDPTDAASVVKMTRTYAQDPMARGEDLPQDIQEQMIDVMREHPAFISFLAFEGDDAIGIANCLISLSTFRAQRLINIHDLCVAPDARGTGVSRQLLLTIEEYARENNFAGITLEVKGRNSHARDVYKSMGFLGSRTPEEEATFFCFKEV